MESSDSHEQVAELLRLLPGLEVQRTWLSDGFAHYWLTIDSMDCLGRLVNHVEFCNSGVGVDSDGSPTGYGAHAPPVRFTIRLAYDAADTPSQLEILGIFLARDLKALGLLPAVRADELQRRWNAVVR